MEVRTNPSFNVHLRRGDAWALKAHREGTATPATERHVRSRKLARRRRVPPAHKLFGFKLTALAIGALVVGGVWWAMNRNKTGTNV